MNTRSHESAGGLTATGVTVLGLAVNAALGVAKVLAGILWHSQTIFADGLHSLSDLASDVAVLAGLRVSGRPADEDHRYGHRRAMTLATAVLALLLMGATAFIGYHALQDLLARVSPPIQASLPLAIAVVSIVSKEWLYRLTLRVGRRAGDTSVVANAWHHRGDAWSSVAAAAGLAAVAFGGQRWHFVDHVTALVLGVVLAVIAYRILGQAIAELMDRAPSRATIRRIEQAVLATDGVRGFHALRARRLGGMVEMDIHVQVDPLLTVRRGHDIARDVRSQVEAACPDVVSVIVHVEPAEA